MIRKSISIAEFQLKPFTAWNDDWFLLTAGDFGIGKYNTMTVSWGSIGCLWNKPFVQVFSRPSRYTYQFLDEYPTFSLCAFSKEYRKDLNLLGSTSGRDGDKIAKTSLTSCAAQKIAAPIFDQAKLVIECKKLYWTDIDPMHFVDPEINIQYSRKDYHRVYYGEIVSVSQAEN